MVIRKRNDKLKASPTLSEPEYVPLNEKLKALNPPLAENKYWGIALIVVSLVSLLTRCWRLNNPSQVVFDEVHFGKFASYYLKRSYFFDVHPPLGKLLLAAVGYFLGYDGHFLFDNIGDDYIANKVP